jgi:hypothetical protein
MEDGLMELLKMMSQPVPPTEKQAKGFKIVGKLTPAETKVHNELLKLTKVYYRTNSPTVLAEYNEKREAFWVNLRKSHNLVDINLHIDADGTIREIPSQVEAAA